MYIALLQIGTTLPEQGLPSPGMLLFNHLVIGIMPIINRPPFGTKNDDQHHKALVDRQCKNDQEKHTPKNPVSFLMGPSVVVQQ